MSSSSVPAAATAASKRIILVHGTGHGGWCWYKVATLLRAAGHRVEAPDLAASGADARPLRDAPTFEDYSRPLLDALRALPPGERAVLVGHSFGGMSIALAAEELPEKVAAAVFVTAFMPDCAGPRTRAIEELPLLDWMDSVTDDGHAPPSVFLGPEFLRRLLYQLSPEEDYTLSQSLARVSSYYVADQQQRPPFSADRYGAVSKVYVVAKQDQAMIEEYQRQMIASIPVAEVREMEDADHMAMLSKPEELAGHLADIANTQRGSGPATMAPVEEQEEEGTVGGGGLLPRYAVGSEVEVQIADRGFHGAYYEAIVTARLPDSGGYEVVYSTLVEDGGGGPLREAVAPVNVRPRPSPLPPPGAARCDLNVFDMVEAYHNEGWWPGVVSGAWPASTVMEPRYAVSLPTREVVEVVASLVRPRRVFVRGRWMDMQEVVPRVPLYDEGSNVEVICPQGKQGMMTATVIKMVDSANYVVQHGDSKRSILVLHSRYIRPPPDFDRLKFQYTLEPSAEVEVYQDGTWLPGVISEIGSCESSKYAVRVKKHNNADEDDYTLVSSAFLRPCCKWDGQQWRLSSTKASYQLHKKHARKRKYTLSIENSLSPVFSTPGGDSDQNSFVRNKRMRTDNVRNEGLHMRHSLHPNEVTTGSSSKGDIDMEAPADKHTTMMEKLDNEIEAKGKECMPASNIVLNMSCKHGDRKKRNCLTKAFANTRGNNKSSYLDVVEISDSSGYSDGIEIDDSSSCNPSRRRKRRKSSIDTGDGLNCRIVQLHQESLPNSAQNTPSNQCVLLALGLEEASHVPSNTEGVPLTPLSCYPDLRMQPLQVLPTLNERKELPLSDHVCSEAEPVAPYDSTARDGIQEMCQEVTEAKILLADDCDEVPDTFLLTSESSKQSVGDPIHGKASSMRQRSRNSEVSISLKIGSSSSAEQFLPSEDMEVPERCKKTHDVMGMVNNIAGICLKEKDNFMNCMPCPNSEGSSSLAHPGRILVHPAMTMDLSAFMPAPNSNGLPPELVTSSLLLGLLNKMEVFTRLPQNLHFSKLLQDSHPELREGKAIGLVISFSHLAESIQNMRIQDEEKKIQQKMSSLAELEENGFEVGALKERLENLLRIKSRQMDFKGKKAILEQAILEKEGAYNTVEQKVGILDIGIKELERMLLHAQEEKASLVEQKSAIGLEISKLQGDACRAEELYMSTESDFGRTATAPWEACLPADNTCL